MRGVAPASGVAPEGDETLCRQTDEKRGESGDEGEADGGRVLERVFGVVDDDEDYEDGQQDDDEQAEPTPLERALDRCPETKHGPMVTAMAVETSRWLKSGRCVGDPASRRVPDIVWTVIVSHDQRLRAFADHHCSHECPGTV